MNAYIPGITLVACVSVFFGIPIVVSLRNSLLSLFRFLAPLTSQITQLRVPHKKSQSSSKRALFRSGSKNLDDLSTSSPAGECASKDVYTVCYASERTKNNPFKVFPWDYQGKLQFDGADFHFIGSRKKSLFSPKRKYLKLRFPQSKVRIAYLRISGLDWMRVEAHKRFFYFSSSLALMRNNKENQNCSTKDMYYRLTDRI